MFVIQVCVYLSFLFSISYLCDLMQAESGDQRALCIILKFYSTPQRAAAQPGNFLFNYAYLK